MQGEDSTSPPPTRHLRLHPPPPNFTPPPPRPAPPRPRTTLTSVDATSREQPLVGGIDHCDDGRLVGPLELHLRPVRHAAFEHDEPRPVPQLVFLLHHCCHAEELSSWPLLAAALPESLASGRAAGEGRATPAQAGGRPGAQGRERPGTRTRELAVAGVPLGLGASDVSGSLGTRQVCCRVLDGWPGGYAIVLAQRWDTPRVANVCMRVLGGALAVSERLQGWATATATSFGRGVKKIQVASQGRRPDLEG